MELKSFDGNVVQLEKNGRFGHIAISFENLWLHSHPVRGVELATRADLEAMGSITAILTNPSLELDSAKVRAYLGKAYDREFSWDNDRMYCSELVAKLLEIEPLPMTFNSSHWPQLYSKFAGSLGLSPDDLFEILSKRGFTQLRPGRCVSFM